MIRKVRRKLKRDKKRKKKPRRRFLIFFFFVWVLSKRVELGRESEILLHSRGHLLFSRWHVLGR
jgi:hypothetical protein